VLDQFKGEKQLVFKFKKRKNYKKMRGHRQNLTRVRIESVGSAKAPAAKTAAKKQAAKSETATEKSAVKDTAVKAADAE
ncbi:MAG: bL21 family ribosomal protein, partial [Raoultibacter sp.]